MAAGCRSSTGEGTRRLGPMRATTTKGYAYFATAACPMPIYRPSTFPPGMTVTLFADTHFRGRKIVLKGPMDANKHCFDSDAMEGRFWNDRTRSVIVEGPDHHV